MIFDNIITAHYFQAFNHFVCFFILHVVHSYVLLDIYMYMYRAYNMSMKLEKLFLNTEVIY